MYNCPPLAQAHNIVLPSLTIVAIDQYYYYYYYFWSNGLVKGSWKFSIKHGVPKREK
jgi:hypothetical protein